MSGEYTFVLADASEEEEVENFLLEVDMGLSGDIQEHVLMKEDGQLVAVAKFTPVYDNEYHLDTMVVRADRKGAGLGKLFLGSLIREPWACFPQMGPVQPYCITTLSRGSAVPFYSKLGFVHCDLSEIHWEHVDQCDTCPVYEECRPEPMIYRSETNN